MAVGVKFLHIVSDNNLIKVVHRAMKVDRFLADLFVLGKLLNILYVVRLQPTISTLTAIRSIQRANRDSDGYMIRKYITLKSILFIIFANL